MERLQIPPPPKFDVTKPEEWPKWRKRFERYRIASRLDEQPEENQVNTLIYTMGEDIEDVITSLALTEEEQEGYDVVINHLERHFVVRRNVIFEHAKFNQRHQESGETVDSFITALYCLAEHCGYGALHDEMIWDRLVVGLRDKKLSEQLHGAWQSEQVKKQQELMKSNFKAENGANIDSVRFYQKSYLKNQDRPRMQFKNKTIPPKQPLAMENNVCYQCGRVPAHSKQQCPAREENCNKSQEGALHKGVQEQSEVKINDHSTQPKIGTGADVTVIPEAEYTAHKAFPPLQRADQVLYGAGMNRLSVKGKFTATLTGSRQNNSSLQDVYVVSGLKSGLLGCTTSVALGLVARIDATFCPKTGTEQLPQLFSGLGRMEGEYKIELKPDAKPYQDAYHYHSYLKSKKELKRMEDLGVISRVAEGVRADPNKVKAVTAMEEPKDVSGVRRYLGMTNHLGKYIPQLAAKTQPLRDLLWEKNTWTWGHAQQQAFDSIKSELSITPVMALYNTQAHTVVSADSSSYALGAVLLQQQEDDTLKPVAYASRALSDTERRYAQIEKEGLATTWACERFSDFLVGIDFHIETNHKPLVPLLGSKDLNELPPRIQRLRMRLM
ncbi:hypothetical protein SRHO_G00123750 [Serrasalmus rhombeus]